jgi:hypothetical protein
MRAIITVLLLVVFGAKAKEPVGVEHDSTRVVVADTSSTREVSLEDIHIEAVIEKPAVTLIPKRLAPEVGEAPAMSRSFDQELKQRPKFLDQVGEEQEAGDRMNTNKKNLAKEKK